MADLFETLMLISFGLSWPVNLVKNIRLRSAKGMNLSFFILITLGYLCGIAAKIIKGEVNFVLFAYVLNTLLVACNIVVYFINRGYDRKARI
ncbi:MAG: hypothetical protein HUJ66_02400 [Oscillospiraceae bacterium]|nr:hypothetical protein [Oscillospiraceae bacterium]